MLSVLDTFDPVAVGAQELITLGISRDYLFVNRNGAAIAALPFSSRASTIDMIDLEAANISDRTARAFAAKYRVSLGFQFCRCCFVITLAISFGPFRVCFSPCPALGDYPFAVFSVIFSSVVRFSILSRCHLFAVLAGVLIAPRRGYTFVKLSNGLRQVAFITDQSRHAKYYMLLRNR